MFCCLHCSELLTILNNVVEPESGITMLKNIVENCKLCGEQNIVQSCSHQADQVVHFLLCSCSLLARVQGIVGIKTVVFFAKNTK